MDYLPEEFLDTRLNDQGEKEFLIKWEKKSLEEASWESQEEL